MVGRRDYRLQSSTDYVHKPGVIPIVTFDPPPPSLAELESRFEQSGQYVIVKCASALDVGAFVRKLDFAMVVCLMKTQDDVIKQMSMIKVLQPQIRARKVKVAVITTINAQQLWTRLKEMGVSDTTLEPVKSRALFLKLDRHLQLLRKAMDASKNATSAEGAGVKTAGGAKAGQKKVVGGRVELVAPLTFASDCWGMIERETRRIANRWNIRMFGPSTEHGNWKALDAASAEGEFFLSRKETRDSKSTYWQWVPSGQNQPDKFITDEGQWIFDGNHPEYRAPYWLFSGKTPALVFVKNGAVVATRYTINEAGNLAISPDSKAAKAAGALIRDEAQKASEYSSKKGGARGAAGEKQTYEVKSAPALKVKSDYFLCRDKKPRHVAGKWMLYAVAPGPGVGKWVEQSAKNPEALAEFEKIWCWKLDPEKGKTFLSDQGDWVYVGLPPKFQDGYWIFAGVKPSLTFQLRVEPTPESAEAKEPRAKFRTDSSGILHVATDSAQAEARREAIFESYSAVVQLEEGQDGEGEADDPISRLQKAAKDEDALEDEAAVAAALSETPLESGEAEGGAAGNRSDDGAAEGATEGDENEDDTDGNDQDAATAGFAAEPERDGASAPDAAGDSATPTLYEHDEVSVKSFSKGDEPEGITDKRKKNAQAEAAGGPRTTFFEKPYSDFGVPPGAWSFVSADAKGGKWYVYLPPGFAPASRPELRETKPWWLFRGVQVPVGRDERWGFDGYELKKVERFTELAEFIQKFLANLITDSTHTFSSGQKSSDAGDITQEGQKATEFSGEIKADAERQTADGVFEPETPGRGANDLSIERAESRRLAMQGGPEAIKAKEPPGPSLSLLALAFLYSEINARRGLTVGERSHQFCRYIAASCGGLQAEIWILGSNGFRCLATSEPDGQKTGATRARYGQSSFKGQGVWGGLVDVEDLGVPDQGHFVKIAPFRTSKADGESVVGVMIVGGKSAAPIEVTYLKGIASILNASVCGIAAHGAAMAEDESDAKQAA